MPLTQPKHLINVHAHHSRGRDFEEHLQEWTEQGADLTCVACIGRDALGGAHDYFTNEDLAPWLRKYPDRIFGLAWLRPTGVTDGRGAVMRRRDEGFRGLKMICPDVPYDDPKYFPIYECAQSMGMPILFHTGWVATDPAADSDYMRPWQLDQVARRFPELRILGAHLGRPHENEALDLMEHYPNVYFDLCGGSASKRWQEMILRALAPRPGVDMADPDQNLALGWFRKLCFATDNPPISKWRPAADHILDTLQIPPDLREDFYWRNAMRLLGLKGWEE